MFQTLKILHQSSELMPFVVFLSAPSLQAFKTMDNSNHNATNNGAHRIHSVIKNKNIYLTRFDLRKHKVCKIILYE